MPKRETSTPLAISSQKVDRGAQNFLFAPNCIFFKASQIYTYVYVCTVYVYDIICKYRYEHAFTNIHYRPTQPAVLSRTRSGSPSSRAACHRTTVFILFFSDSKDTLRFCLEDEPRMVSDGSETSFRFWSCRDPGVGSRHDHYMIMSWNHKPI